MLHVFDFIMDWIPASAGMTRRNRRNENKKIGIRCSWYNSGGGGNPVLI
jgi:hypothetical protein